jgi:hypothetical protein
MVNMQATYQSYKMTNAGPHQDKEFMDYVKKYCGEQGWKWEPQAPQMPHANNLDLAVFPSMSKSHCAILSGYSKSTEPSTDDIWKCAESVWKKLPSCTVARGYMHAHRILKKGVEQRGCKV